MKFTKMEGCGNDYIYINCFEERVEDPATLAVAMSERHFGVGADGIVLIMPSKNGDLRMRMFNLDGSEGEMCGNAARCIGKYAYERGLTDKKNIALETAGGLVFLELEIEAENVRTVTVDMGKPVLSAEKIPVKHDVSPVIDKILKAGEREMKFTCVSMGNPHAVTIVENTEDLDVEKYGSRVEKDTVFPNKVNVEFVEIIDRENIKMRVWERGSGETLACGTGACAAAVACILKGLCGRKVNVRLKGGNLSIFWNDEDDHVYMRGPAEFSFDGIWLR